jgi:hypothetical protein
VDVVDPAMVEQWAHSRGNVELRLILTARLSQTPDGYTQRIDHVELTVAP